MGIKPGRYLPSPLPAALAEKADRLGLPLLQLPTDMRFAATQQLKEILLALKKQGKTLLLSEH